MTNLFGSIDDFKEEKKAEKSQDDRRGSHPHTTLDLIGQGEGFGRGVDGTFLSSYTPIGEEQQPPPLLHPSILFPFHLLISLLVLSLI